MAATDHTRLRTARAGARAKSTDDRRDLPQEIGAPPPPSADSRPALIRPLFPRPDSRTHAPTHARWVLRTTPVSWEHSLEASPLSTDSQHSDVRTWPDEHEDFGPEADGRDALAAMDAEGLRAVCRTVSDIHAQLALAYAYGLTFERAVHHFIPPDTLDILPCLSIGVLHTLDTQIPRLDALLDHLGRQAAGISSRGAAHRTHGVGAFRPGPLRHSRRDADFAEPALGDTAVRSPL